MNPWYGQAPNQQFWDPITDILTIRWTHYDDLRNVYGVEDPSVPNSPARVTWDNVGVQYGLASLKAMKITPAEFLHLNRHVGGWKHPSQMVQETFPFFGTTQAEINKMRSDMTGGREVTRISPLYWGSRMRLDRISATADSGTRLVLIVEDILDTGLTLDYLKKHLESGQHRHWKRLSK